MEDVQAVTHPAHGDEWPPAHQPTDRSGNERSENDRDRHQREGGEPAGVHDVVVDRHRRDREPEKCRTEDSSHGERPRDSGSDAASDRQDAGQDRPGQQLSRSHMSSVVDEVARLGQKTGDNAGSQQHRENGTDAATMAHEQRGHQQWEDDVELLLDRQRPEVLNG